MAKRFGGNGSFLNISSEEHCSEAKEEIVAASPAEFPNHPPRQAHITDSVPVRRIRAVKWFFDIGGFSISATAVI
jgi:hypothetical protein